MLSECIEWPGNRLANGYGRVTAGPDKGKKAHRVVWEEAHGPIPEGMIICHHCDNPPCVNLDHLYLGTHTDNARDRSVRGRAVRGERVNTNRLTVNQVNEIRWLCDNTEFRHRDIGTVYGVTQPMVGFIARRESWVWLPDMPEPPSTTTTAALWHAYEARQPTPKQRAARNAKRALPGRRNPSVKLTEDQVYEIRARVDNGEVQQRIADDYGIQQVTVSTIGRRASWAHLPDAA